MSNEHSPGFGTRLRRAREEVSMHIVMLSDETGIPVSTLAALELASSPHRPITPAYAPESLA